MRRLFDKIFNSASNGRYQGIIHKPLEIMDSEETIELSCIYDDVERELIAEIRDPSKAIDASHWDGLTSEVQEALSKHGFYREGADKEVIII